MNSEELEFCELGTHEYWEKCYKEEMKNFKNHGDVGDIWFGEDIVERLINWIEKKSVVKKTDYIADIGCGNGMFLNELFKEGYNNLLGIDYSESAINLAKAIAEQQNLNIKFEMWDVLDDNFIENIFDVVFDKGTYDAISLSENATLNRKKYIKNIHNCLKKDGLLIITSCNWTSEELSEHFENEFVYFDVIPTPQFKFGGKIGNVVSSVAYKKK